MLKLWIVKVFSWARTNLYSEPFQHNNWQYIIVLKFITVKYWTQIGLQVNLGWDIFIHFHSRLLSSIYTASSNFLFFKFWNITYAQFSSASAVQFFVVENHSFLVFTISIEGRSDGAGGMLSECESWPWDRLIVCGHGVRCRAGVNKT